MRNLCFSCSLRLYLSRAEGTRLLNTSTFFFVRCYESGAFCALEYNRREQEKQRLRRVFLFKSPQHCIVIDLAIFF